MAWTKSGKYLEFREEIEKRARKIGNDAGMRDFSASESQKDLRWWMDYFFKQVDFYSLQKSQVNGSEAYTPEQLKKVVWWLTHPAPAVSAYLIRNYAEVVGCRSGLERDLWVAFERFPSIGGDKDRNKNALATIAHSLFMSDSLGEARKRYRQIGTMRFRYSGPASIHQLVEQGYAEQFQFGKSGFIPNEVLRRNVKLDMREINSDIAEWIC